MSTNFSQFKLGIELTASNAVSWFKRMTLLLQLYDGCWKAVTEDTGTDAIKARARLAISMNVGDDLLHIVDPSKSPKVIWDALKAQFVGVSAARKMSLQKMQTSFKKEFAESLDDFIARGYLTAFRGQVAVDSSHSQHARRGCIRTLVLGCTD